MNLIRKAPGRLTRAIVCLGARTGKKLASIRNNGRALGVASDDQINRAAEDFESYARLNERTTITIETETMLIVRGERRSSTPRAECGSDRPSPIDDGGNERRTKQP